VLAGSIAIVMVLGMTILYRLLSRQVELAKQQQNFISAVSHELKTPLTSIRMYGEMLRSGWVEDESKKQQYYDFIFFESERLSRLIANVLQLARINHGNHTIELSAISPAQLLTRVAGKIAVQQQASGFTINRIEPDQSLDEVEIKVDEDAFCQIIINLVDNAIKFAANAERKQIDLGFHLSEQKQQVVFYVRDYGPGIPRQQLKKIFRLFYRPGNELTRAAPGTGIGLALVTQLAEAMKAKVDVINRQPGVEFQICFRCYRYG
jgi:signal transduction histidine kinase